MEKPVIFVVDENPQSLRALEGELNKRYGADYQIRGEQTPTSALAKLEDLKKAGAEVAILLAGCWLPEMTGADFLQRAHSLHKGAKRGLLLDWGDQSADRLLVEAMSLNIIDAFSAKPIYSPDEEFHQFITSVLNEWARENRPPQFVVFKIVGEQWSRRSHELRDLLTRNGISFEFYDVDSEEGRALLEKSGSNAESLPVVIHRLAPGFGETRPFGLCLDRPGLNRRRKPPARLAPGAFAVSDGNQPSGCICSR